MGLLLLPGEPGFAETLLQPPPNWHETAAKEDDYGFVFDSHSHLLRPVTPTELEDYCWGGELDYVDEMWEEQEEERNSILSLPTFEELTGLPEEEFFLG